MICRSNCELNAVRHASVELEEVAAATMWWDFQAVKRAVETFPEVDCARPRAMKDAAFAATFRLYLHCYL